jgi:hypothetical protein
VRFGRRADRPAERDLYQLTLIASHKHSKEYSFANPVWPATRWCHRFGVCSTFQQNRPAGKEALYTREISFDPGLLRITIIRSGRLAAAA